VEKLLSHIEKKSFKSRDEEEVAGYAKLMDTIFDNYQVIPLSENHIKQLHQSLLRYTSKDARHRGKYKQLSNSVAAFDAAGKEIGIVFETATPFDTPRLMEELVEWARKNLAGSSLHPLIVIGIFIVNFLAIHPFQDGNGRLSRALTTMLLLKSGYAYVPYSSMESIIEVNKDAYYLALRRTQKNMWNRRADYGPWLSFFFTTLQKQKKTLESKIVALTSDDTKLGKTARAILALFDDKAEWSVPELAAALKLNLNTAAKTTKKLVTDGYLVKQGTTRGAWYERSKRPT
jgi:Fic family protein